MRTMLVRLLLPGAVFVVIFMACKGLPSSTPPITNEIIQVVKQQCVGDACAFFRIYYPQIRGGDSMVIANVNSALRQVIIGAVGGSTSGPFEKTIDEAGDAFLKNYVTTKEASPEVPPFDLFVQGSVLAVSDKVLSANISGSASLGTPPTFFTYLGSFDLQNKGKILSPSQVFSDSAAVMPILQRAYKRAKGQREDSDIKKIIWPQFEELPMSRFFCITEEGIRFYYNDAEAAPHDIGPADVLVTWEELGKLADKDRWF